MESSEIDRRWIIQTIAEGLKSPYWKLLKGQIEEWIANENRLLNVFKKRGIRNPDDMDKFNRAIDRLEYLRMFLVINENIVAYNQTMLERVKVKTTELYRKVESFVKEKVK